MKTYFAAIFDVISSKKIEKKKRFQLDLTNCISFLNEMYKAYLIKEVLPTSGDEFEGLFSNPTSAFYYCRALQNFVYPFKIRCGLGYGSIEYNKENWPANFLNGEAFYNARDAINFAHKNFKDQEMIAFKSGRDLDLILNSMFDTRFIIKESQSELARLIDILIDVSSSTFDVSTDKAKKYVFYKKFIVAKIKDLSNLNKTKFKLNNDYNEGNFDLFIKNAQPEKMELIDGLIYKVNLDKTVTQNISQLLGCSKENVRKHINSGKIKNIRELDYAISILFNKEFN